MQVKSYAKLNLTLDIIGRRPDGYHLLETIMQPINLVDYITIEEASVLSVATNCTAIPNNEHNIAYKAARLFYHTTKIQGAVKIFITKHIPTGAGMGGGSGNAAAVLTALNTLYKTNRSVAELQALGIQLGADVPFFLQGGPCFCKGIGEQVQRIENTLQPWVVVCKPSVFVSTKWAYAQIQQPYQTHPQQTAAVLNAMQTGATDVFCNHLFNVMEDAILPCMPEIKKCKEQLLAHGASAALMTGSGSAVYGIFKEKKTAENACSLIQSATVFLTKFI